MSAGICGWLEKTDNRETCSQVLLGRVPVIVQYGGADSAISLGKAGLWRSVRRSYRVQFEGWGLLLLLLVLEEDR